MIRARQSTLDDLAAGIVRLVGSRRLRQRNNHLVRRVAARIAHLLNQRVMNSGAIQRLPDLIFVRLLIKGHPDMRATFEVDPQWDVMPEQHAQHAGDGKNQGKPKEVPLLPEPVDIRCTKQFQTHAQTLSGTDRPRNLLKSK